MLVERWENGVLVETYDDGNPPPPRNARSIFLSLTEAERNAIHAAMLTHPTLLLFVLMLSADGEVRSDDPVTVQGCTLANALGLLTTARVSELFGVTL